MVSANNEKETTTYFTDAAPADLQIRSINTSTQKITWAKLQGADGYYVYCSTKKNGNYAFIGYTQATSLRNLDLKKGVTYYYKIQAYRIIDGTYFYSPISDISMKKAGYPQTPSISLQKINKQRKKMVIIRWSNISDAEYIQLYRKKSGQGYKKILDKKITTNIKKGVTISYITTKGEMAFKIRTYNKSNDIRYYGKFSNIKKVKLK